MRFAGTKRNTYTSEKVRQMRSERKTKKANVDGVTDAQYQHSLGDLIGAGHLSIMGFNHLDITTTVDTTPLGQALGMSKNTLIKHNLEFNSYQHSDRDGVRPHMEGYLSSGHPNDPRFKLKGWFNEDGTIRIELVKSFSI
jgi:hypothetical protein